MVNTPKRSLKCPRCEGKIKKDPEEHDLVCRGATEDERVYFKTHGRWPKGARKKPGPMPW